MHEPQKPLICRVEQLCIHLHSRAQDDCARTKAKLWSLCPAWLRKQIENFTLICRNDHARPPAAISRRKTLPLSVITPSIWPRGGSPYWPIRYTCALIKWESARAFIRSVMALLWGWYAEEGAATLFTFFFLLSYDPTKTRLQRTRGVVRNPAATLIRMGRVFHCVRNH